LKERVGRKIDDLLDNMERQGPGGGLRQALLH
jgi:hypothetical protein